MVFFNSLLGVGQEMIRTIIFIFALSRLFPTWVRQEISHNGVLYFFEFFCYFFSEFSIRGQVGNDRNNNFHFHSFSAFSNMFWPKKKPYWCFLIFLIFLLFFSNSLLRIRQEMLGTKIFIFTRSRPFPTCFCFKRSHNGIFFFHFFSIFYYFLEFSTTGRVGNDWNDNFYCHSFSAFLNLFWLENKAIMGFFFFFWNFFAIFLSNSLLGLGQEMI